MSQSISVEASVHAFERRSVDLIEPKQLKAMLEKGRPLRIKFGMDPSSPDLHVGHAIPLLMLRELQDLGHTIVLIVGDATAMVGDPTGRNKLRPQLTREEVERNLNTYTSQAALVLDMERTEVRRNSEWFDAMDFQAVLRLTSRMTVARMIERDTFQTRIHNEEPIGIHEFLYPLMQGWDSVEVKADVELGGTDQLFNLLVGRHLQEQEKLRPQVCVTLPLLNGLDGRKMSKSYGNAIGLTESAAEIFGKVMSLSDDVMPIWYRLLTDLSDAKQSALLAGHPREAKAQLAQSVAERFAGSDAAQAARSAFDRQFRDGKLPQDIPERSPSDWPADGLPLFVLLREVGLASSSNEARRVIQQGGVRLGGEPHSDPAERIAAPTEPLLVQVGKRRFAYVTSK